MSLSFKDETASNPNSDLWLVRDNSNEAPSVDRSADLASKINDCITINALHYSSSVSEKPTLPFFAVIWNALYFTVEHTVKKKELEYSVFKSFLSGTMELFHITDDEANVAQQLLDLQKAVLSGLSVANIPTDSRDGLLRAHQMALIIAKHNSLYDGQLIPDASQEAAFLLAAANVKRFIANTFSLPTRPPVQAQAPYTPVYSPAPAAPCTKKRKPPVWAWVCAVLALYLVIAAIATGSGDQQGTSGAGTSQTQLTEKSRPKSGAVLLGSATGESEITVIASSTEDYVVTLKSPSGVTRLAFYVRAGDTVTRKVPAGKYYVYFASGKQWYGYGQGLMFGRNTSFSKDDDLLDFEQYTWTYTLYPVTNGNFSETPIDEGEFFG